jgi:hypothetical protein
MARLVILFSFVSLTLTEKRLHDLYGEAHLRDR